MDNPRDFQHSRSAFLVACSNATRHLADDGIDLETSSVAVPLAASTTLATDIFVLSNKRTQAACGVQTRPVIVISSGVHGIEGYAGSVLQCAFLSKLQSLAMMLDHCDLCLIHAVNPWGMAALQRTDQENIDLNRNAHHLQERYSQPNSLVAELRKHLAPQRPLPHQGIGETLGFFTAVLGAMLQHGVGRSVRAVVHGQHDRQSDLFYGGRSLSPHLAAIEKATLDMLGITTSALGSTLGSPTGRPCVVIDLHTGLGPKGQLSLMMRKQPYTTDHLAGPAGQPPQMRTHIRTHFEQRADPLVPGIFCEWLRDGIQRHSSNSQSQSPWRAIVFEVGTLGRGGMAANLSSLRRMVAANQLRHHGSVPDLAKDSGPGPSVAVNRNTTAEKARRDFIDLFAPYDSSWWAQLESFHTQELIHLIETLIHANIIGASGEQH